MEYEYYNERLLTVRISAFCPFALIGFFATAFVFLNTPSQSGTDAYFTIPLTFTICSFFFQEIIEYHKGGFGLKIFYVTVFLKYVVLPVLTCYVGKFSGAHGYFSAAAYEYAIFIQDLELIVCCLAIKYFYARTYRREAEKAKENEYQRTIEQENEYEVSVGRRERYNILSAGGIIVFAVAGFLVLTRGTDRLLSSMRFGIISDALDEEARYGYDIWLAQTMMAFIAIIVVDFFKRRNDYKNSIVNVFIPLVTVALTCLIVFGNNRTMIIYYAICGLMILTAAFPDRVKMFYAIIIPTLAIVMISFTLLKNFHIDVTGSSSMEALGTDITSLQESITAYLCGTESIAKCFHLYGINGSQMQLLTVFSDIVNKTSILGLPGLNTVVKAFSSVPTSYELAMYSTEIVPVAGQTLFFGGYVFGWVLDIIAFVVVMKLLVTFEIKSKLSSDSSKIYINTWLSGIFGFCFCRSLAVMYANCTYIPFYLSIAMWVNRSIRMRMNNE